MVDINKISKEEIHVIIYPYDLKEEVQKELEEADIIDENSSVFGLCNIYKGE
jgi:hypothetical protein